MAAYMASLDKLRQRDDRIYYPAHGPAVTKPAAIVRGMIGHRMQRERQILKLVGEQPRDIPDIVANAYPGLDPRLVPAAGGSVLAHLLDLERRGLVEARGRDMDNGHSRLNKPLAIAAVVVALLLGLLLGGAIGIGRAAVRRARPRDHRHRPACNRCARRTGWCRSSRAMSRWPAAGSQRFGAGRPSGR